MDSLNDKAKSPSPGLKGGLLKVAAFGRRVFSWRPWRRNVGNWNAQAAKQVDFDKKLVYQLSRSRWPSWTQFKYISHYLNPRERWVIRTSFALIVMSLVWWGVDIYRHRLVTAATYGETYIEGLIGNPQHVNPLYANLNDVDGDLATLVFSGLYRRGPRGELKEDLAKFMTISPDQKEYTIEIRTDALWHNGRPVTIDDVVFTYQIATDPEYRSSWRASLAGVKVEKVDDQTVRFRLDRPFAAFRELLVLGIMPSELWREIPPETAALADLNQKPIGSGPFVFKSLTKRDNGTIREYRLTANQSYFGGRPFLDGINFIFYPNFTEAVNGLNAGEVQGLNYLSLDQKNEVRVDYNLDFHELNFPQLTAVFFNPKKNVALADKGVRQALARGIDREKIIADIFGGKGNPVYSPIQPGSFAYNPELETLKYDQAEAAKLLDAAGWKTVELTEEAIKDAEAATADKPEADQASARALREIGPGTWRKKDKDWLTVGLTTVNRGENTSVIEAIKSGWEQLGVKTLLIAVEPAQVNAQVIRPREYEALFYGVIVGSDPDAYSFWHSSQINERGLNIANWSNKEVDQLLEDARLVSDEAARREKYFRFQEIFSDEAPAVFVYSPAYIYPLSNEIKGFAVDTIILPRDRFANIVEWYVKTKKSLDW